MEVVLVPANFLQLLHTCAGLSSDQRNPIDVVWDVATDAPRPAPPSEPARVHSVEYAGVSHMQKLRDVQDIMNQKGASVGIVDALDEVCETDSNSNLIIFFYAFIIVHIYSSSILLLCRLLGSST